MSRRVRKFRAVPAPRTRQIASPRPQWIARRLRVAHLGGRLLLPNFGRPEAEPLGAVGLLWASDDMLCSCEGLGGQRTPAVWHQWAA